MGIFYILAFLIIYGVMNTVIRRDPVTCAIHLALAMVALAGLFFHLGAHFIAGVQLAVYAGAVMVLFVMVLMLFDSKKEENYFPKFHSRSFLKALLCMFIFGLLSGNIPHSTGTLSRILEPQIISTKDLAILLFSKYVLLFEWLGLILLVVAVGVVVLSKEENRGMDH